MTNTKQKATITRKANGGAIRGNRKENHLHREIVALGLDGRVYVTVRTYWPGSRCYACIWVNGCDVYPRGGGWAGGGGYDKESAAVAAAIGNAGITLARDISGRGDAAIVEAVEAIARAVTRRKVIIHVAHG